MPIIPSKAAARAPIPNHRSTKPDVNTSATIRTNPSTTQKIQSQLPIYAPFIKVDSPLEHVLHHEPDIRRSLSQATHEVRIPVFSIRNIDPHVITVTCQLALEITSNP